MLPHNLKINVSPAQWKGPEWRIVLRSYCGTSNEETKKHLYEIIKKMAEVFTQQGNMTFHPDTYSDCAKEVSIEAFKDTTQHGMYLVPPHGEMLWNGKKKAIVKLVGFRALYEGFTFLCAGKRCYGVIRFQEPKEITIEDFYKLESRHRISDSERIAWWPKAQRFYYYELRDFFKFDKPILVHLPKGPQTFIKNVKQYFSALEIDPDESPKVCLELPSPLEADEFLLSQDGEELAAYSIAESDGHLISQGEYSIQLLIDHAAIHEKAEDALLEAGEVPLEVLAHHSKIVSEMELRGMEHRLETILDYDSPTLDDRTYLRIKALGTRANIEEWNSKHKKFSGILLTVRGKRILLDCGDQSFLKEDPAFVLISHFHPDHFAWHTFEPRKEESYEDSTEDFQRAPIRAYGSTIYRHIMQFEHPECEVYVEPFCGSCSVLFSREPAKTEVVNDLNDDTIFALRFIKGLTKSEMMQLKRFNWEPNIDTWKRNKELWKNKNFKSRAHRFYLYRYLSLYSFHWTGSMPTGSRVQTDSVYNPESLLKAQERLKHVKIYKGDYREVIKIYDSPKTFMFLDPPYRQHMKGSYEDEGLDWDTYYGILAKLKCKYIALNSNSSEDKSWYRKLGLKFHVATFPGSSSYRVSTPRSKKKFICGANFELLKCKGKKKKSHLPFKGSWDFEVVDDVDDFDDDSNYTDEVPEELFIAHPKSKCEVSDKAEKAGFNIDWAESYEYDTFKFSAFPVKHSTQCPTVAWKIRVAGKTILYMPDVLEFDKSILTGVDVYIGDGSSFSRNITHEEGIGHMSIKHQIELTKEAKIPEIYFIHCGKEIIENPNLEEVSEFEKEAVRLGANILSDNDELKKRLQLVKLHDVLERLPEKFSTIEKYFLVGSLAVSGRGVDIDILERGDRDEAARHRLYKALQGLSDRVSFIRSDSGPMGSYIPCFRRTYERFGNGYVIMSGIEGSDSLDLALTGQTAKQAMVSRREDKIIPHRFFALQKTHAGYHQREAFSPEEALEMIREDKFPYIGEEKIDGNHWEVHWDGSKLTVYSEDGRLQRESQWPELAAEIKKLKPFISVNEVDAWVPKEEAVKAGLVPKEREMRNGKVHLGRGDLSGYLHSDKYSALIAKNLVLHVYDVVWTDKDQQLFKRTLEDRISVRTSLIPKTGMVQSIESIRLNDAKAIVRFWKEIMKRVSAEGIMLKPLEDRYVLWYSGGLWVKCKSLRELSAKVLRAIPVKESPGVYNAICAIQDRGKDVYIGKTFNVKLPLKAGQIIEVRFQNISRYTDPQTGERWFNWFRPNVVDIRKEKVEADSVEIAERLVRATDGEVAEKPLPKIAKEAMGRLSLEELDSEMLVAAASDLATHFSIEIEDFVEVTKEPPMPSEDGSRISKVSSLSREKLESYNPSDLPKGFFVIQSHYRGESTHFDLRIKDNGSLEGETLLMQVMGVVTEPVTTIEQARAWSQRIHSDEPSRWTKFYPGMPPHRGIMISEKGMQPLEWATKVKTVHEPGQVGATKEFPGVFYGEDWGIAYRTVSKPWFVETWLFGKWFNGVRLIERLLPTTKKTERVGKTSAFWRGHIADPKSPPYIFSPSFFENTEWIPEHSALPPHWESIIPINLRWWGKGLPQKQRLSLISAAFNWLVEENFLKGRKKILDESDFAGIILKDEKWPYVLHRVWWRGPAHVRNLPVSVWRLRLDHKDAGLLTFEFEADPATGSVMGIAALRNISKSKPPGGSVPEDWLKFSGSIPAGHPENPNKKLIARVIVEDSGDFRPVSDSKDFLSGNFGGGKFGLKGYYIFKRESPESDFWLFRKSPEGEHD